MPHDNERHTQNERTAGVRIVIYFIQIAIILAGRGEIIDWAHFFNFRVSQVRSAAVAGGGGRSTASRPLVAPLACLR